MELLQLRYFLDSAENENFSKTAEKYMVPASCVSIAVKKGISPLTVVNDTISEAKTLTLSAITAEGLDISPHIAIIIHHMIKVI